jgi:5'(3')-deoxyribonucleotidase
MITLYLDMDGVLADFNKEYTKFNPSKEDRTRFRDSVMTHRIFENLDKMPDADILLSGVAKIPNLHIEILTSMGTFNVEQGIEAKRQKILWLDKHGITYKPNFVRTKTEKAQYATSDSILIDDSIGCITPFNKKDGNGILHTSAQDSLNQLNHIISLINGVS